MSGGPAYGVPVAGKITLRGIPLDVLSAEEAGKRMEHLLSEDGCSVVVTPNCEMLYAAEKNAVLRSALTRADLAVPDGIGVVKAAKMSGTPLKERLAGIDVCFGALRTCAKKGLGVYLLGGKPGVAEKAAENLRKLIPSLVIAGAADGYFSEAEEADIIQKINDSGAAFLVAGLGSPKQELFMVRNAAELKTRACMGVGGSLDVWSGEAKRAPERMTRSGLEWLYRLAKQPSRIRRVVRIPAYLLLVKFTKKT